MSKPIFCHGCGQPLEVPEDYQRAKMQCPQCGVICTLPPPDQRGPARKSSKAKSQSAEPPKSKPVRREPEEPRSEAVIAKPSATEKPRRSARAVTATPPPPTPPRRTDDDEDNGKPYEVTGGPENFCPECGKLLEDGAVMCMRCGLNSETGEKATQTFQPLERHWNTGWSLQARLTTFIIGEIVGFISGSTAMFLTGDPATALPTFAVTFLTFTAMWGFLIGTWDSLDLERNRRGQARLTKTFRLYFWTASVTKINLGEFQGVITGRSQDITIWDWLMVFILLTWAIVPGIIFFYLAFFKHTFYAALVRHHGNPEIMLYRGANEEQMKEIAAVVRDVGRWKVDLPVEK
jgi:DNA-directed RNA polymerase subunit M/transcription elongation factor TFIIS